MAHFVFTDPFFSQGGTDLSDAVTGMTLEYSADEIDDASAGDTTHVMLAGALLDYTLTVEFAQDLAATKVDVTLFPAVGTAVAIIVRNDNAAGVGATNPNYTATMILMSYPPIGAKIGEKAVTTAVYRPGGALSRAEA